MRPGAGRGRGHGDRSSESDEDARSFSEVFGTTDWTHLRKVFLLFLELENRNVAKTML